MKDKCIIMKQISKHKWELLAPNGSVIVSDLTLSSKFEAQDYAQRYISSFYSWEIKLIPLEGK